MDALHSSTLRVSLSGHHLPSCWWSHFNRRSTLFAHVFAVALVISRMVSFTLEFSFCVRFFCLPRNRVGRIMCPLNFSNNQFPRTSKLVSRQAAGTRAYHRAVVWPGHSDERACVLRSGAERKSIIREDNWTAGYDRIWGVGTYEPRGSISMKLFMCFWVNKPREVVCTENHLQDYLHWLVSKDPHTWSLFDDDNNPNKTKRAQVCTSNSEQHFPHQ